MKLLWHSGYVISIQGLSICVESSTKNIASINIGFAVVKYDNGFSLQLSILLYPDVNSRKISYGRR